MMHYGREAQSLKCTIANGAATSDAIDIGSYINATLILPSGWDTQNITYTGSNDGETFVPVYDKDGVAVSIASAAASRGYEVHAAVMNFHWIKVVSGANQNGAVTLTLAVKD